jgi:hypothetical protein
MAVNLLRTDLLAHDGPSAKPRRLVEALNRTIRQLAVTRVDFNIPATELGAGTICDLASPVAGVISKMVTVVQTAIVTGGAVTATVDTVAVDGLSITVANSAAKGVVQSDTPTSGHASTAVAVGSTIGIVPAAAFNGGGALSGYIEITETPVDPND